MIVVFVGAILILSLLCLFAYLVGQLPENRVGNLAQWAGVSATFSAVLVALFKDDILKRLRRPKFKITLKLGQPDCNKSYIKYLNHFIPSFYFRLEIENVGKTRAEKVQVFGSKLERKNDKGEYEVVDKFLPMNFKWSYTGEIFADGISPKLRKHCDFFHIVEPPWQERYYRDQQNIGVTPVVWELDVEAKSFTGNHILRPGVYRVSLTVAAANCAPTEVVVEVGYEGKWFPDEAGMFSNGISVNLVN